MPSLPTKKRQAELSPAETSDDDVVETSDDDDDDFEPEVIADSSNRNRTGVVLPVLVELLSMKISDTKQPKGDPIKLYGSIYIDDAEGKMTLFKEGKENSMSISSDGSLPLVSPSRCIVGSSLGLFICLKNHNNDHDLGDAYFAMTYQWESKEKEWFFDRPVSACFAGEHGYTMVNFIVFQKAVQADIEIKLHDDNMLVGNQENFVHDVYGQIMYKIEDLIYVSAYEKKHYRTMAFDVPKDEHVQLEPGAAIPLSKHVVAVPYNSYLEIVATLWISGTQVSHTISFDPAVSGCREVLVNKAISLKVTWYTPQPWLKAWNLDCEDSVELKGS